MISLWFLQGPSGSGGDFPSARTKKPSSQARPLGDFGVFHFRCFSLRSPAVQPQNSTYSTLHCSPTALFGIERVQQASAAARASPKTRGPPKNQRMAVGRRPPGLRAAAHQAIIALEPCQGPVANSHELSLAWSAVLRSAAQVPRLLFFGLPVPAPLKREQKTWGACVSWS